MPFSPFPYVAHIFAFDSGALLAGIHVFGSSGLLAARGSRICLNNKLSLLSTFHVYASVYRGQFIETLMNDLREVGWNRGERY